MSTKEVLEVIREKEITNKTLKDLKARGVDSFNELGEIGDYKACQLIYKADSLTVPGADVFIMYTPRGAQIIGKLRINGGVESLPDEGSPVGASVEYKWGRTGDWNPLVTSGGRRKLKRTRRNRRKNRKSKSRRNR